MDSYLCSRLARALNARWFGAQLQQAWQDTRGRLILKLRRPGESALLLVSAEPTRCGLGLIPKRPPSPPRPPALAAYLRAHIVGGRLTAADNTPFESEVTLTFQRGEDSYGLKLDMTGNKPALLVIDDAAKIKVVSGELWGEQRPGGVFKPRPKPQGRLTPLALDRETLQRSQEEGTTLKELLFGVPAYLLQNLEGRGAEVAERGLRALTKVREERFALSVENDRLLCDSQREQDDDEALTVAGGWLVQAGAEREEGADGAGPTGETERAESRWRKKLQRRIKNIQLDLSNMADAAEVERSADALAASLGSAEKGMESVEIDNLHTPGEKIKIPLDPSKTPGENLDRLYGRAKKIRRARAVAAKRLDAAQLELKAGPPPELPKPGRGQGVTPLSGGGAVSQGPYRRYRSSDGWTLLVGRNSVENDRLVREAKPWDLWLHARDGAGAHVVVKKPGKDSKVLQRTLAEAAGLAALYSKRSGEASVEVMYVEAERVKKPKGASAGRVLVSGERTLRIAPGAGTPKEV